MKRFTVEPGRNIYRDGEPFISIDRVNTTNCTPTMADALTHTIAHLLSEHYGVFPMVSEVASELRRANARIARDMPHDADAPDGENGDLCVEIRLQVCPDGQWAIRVGDPGWDTDHHGFWGSSSLDGSDFNAEDVAEDLINQCRDDAAQTDND